MSTFTLNDSLPTTLAQEFEPTPAAWANGYWGPGVFDMPAGAQEFTGVVDVTAPAATIASAGSQVFISTAAVAAPTGSVSAVSSQAFIASGSVTAPAAGAEAGTASEVFVGTTSVVVPAGAIASSATEVFVASGDVASLGAIAGTGVQALIAAGDVTAAPGSMAGEAVEVFVAEGLVTAPHGAVLGSHLEVIGEGSVAAPIGEMVGTATTMTAAAPVSVGGHSFGGWLPAMPPPPRPQQQQIVAVGSMVVPRGQIAATAIVTPMAITGAMYVLSKTGAVDGAVSVALSAGTAMTFESDRPRVVAAAPQTSPRARTAPMAKAPVRPPVIQISVEVVAAVPSRSTADMLADDDWLIEHEAA